MDSSKLALCVGINYPGTPNKLSGCNSDAKRIRDHLKEKGYEVVMLCDDSPGESNGMPTKKNIIQYLLTLVENANRIPDCHVVFTYSGHGSSIFDRDGDESDKKDELIVCMDNQIMIDDEFYEHFASKLNPDVKAFCIFDSCHSGTMLDLEYKSLADGKTILEHKNVNTKAEVVCISGCRDSEFSADAYVGTDDVKYAGALTHCLLHEYKEEKTILELVNDVRKTLKVYGYSQYPELTMSRENLGENQIGNFF